MMGKGFDVCGFGGSSTWEAWTGLLIKGFEFDGEVREISGNTEDWRAL